MDKSIRLPLIRGELKVPATELGSDEWLTLVEHTLGLCKPQIKFFTGFTSLQEEVKKYPIKQVPNISFDIKDELLYGGIWDNPRFIMLTLPPQGRDEVMQAKGKADILLLTREAKILLWYREFTWAHGNMTGGIVTTDTRWGFRYLEVKDLKPYLTPKVGMRILRQLHLVAEQSYEARQKYAESMRNLRDTLGSMHQAIAQ